MGALNELLTEKNLGVGPYGVKIVRLTLALAPFADKSKLQDEEFCRTAVQEINAIMK